MDRGEGESEVRARVIVRIRGLEEGGFMGE
jgi:hypothetical protein